MKTNALRDEIRIIMLYKTYLHTENNEDGTPTTFV